MSKITGIILAGGKSSRMGLDKAFIPYFGKKLVEHNLNLLQAVCDEVLISANNSVYQRYNLPVIPDTSKETGPIGGLHACLSCSGNEFNLFLSCDMPFVNQNLVYGLIHHISDEHDIIAYSFNNKVEPLLALYSKKIIPEIEKKIALKNFKLQSLIGECKTKIIPLESDVFISNLNTKSEVSKFKNQFKWKLPNMVLVAGNGRNVGKTYFTCSLIKHLSKQHKVIAIKTSPHFHDVHEQSQVLAENKNFKVLVENKLNDKDSSQLFQAGSSKTYFIMAKDNGLEAAFDYLYPEIKEALIVVESGGLHELILPGIFFFINLENMANKKKQYIKYQPIMVKNNRINFDFDIENMGYRNQHVVLNNYNYNIF